MTDTNKHKHAVILSGGGADGAFEVGVIKALFAGKSPATDYQPLDPDIYTGTSVGSYSAAVLVSESKAGSVAAADYLEDIWLNKIAAKPPWRPNGAFRIRGNPTDYFNPISFLNNPLRPFGELAADSVFLAQDWFKRVVDFARSKEPLLHRTLELFDLSTFVSSAPLEQLMRETIQLNTLRQSDKVLRIAVTNWETGRVELFGNEDMTGDLGYKALMASTSIPGFYPPVMIEGHPHVDGGALLTTPLNPAIRAGADTLHVIYLDPEVRHIPTQQLRSTLDTFSKFYAIFTAAQTNRDHGRAEEVNRQLAQRNATESRHRHLTIHRYRPDDDLSGLLGLLNFKYDRMVNLVERGIKEAVEHNCEESGCLLPSQDGPAEMGTR